MACFLLLHVLNIYEMRSALFRRVTPAFRITTHNDYHLPDFYTIIVYQSILLVLTIPHLPEALYYFHSLHAFPVLLKN